MAISSVSMASWILAGYWAAVVLSRIVLSRIALGADPFRILLFLFAGRVFRGAGGRFRTDGGNCHDWKFGLTGWALAGIYPAVLGIAGARFQSHSGTVFGILFAIALMGGMIVPWVSGHVAALAGLRWVFA